MQTANKPDIDAIFADGRIIERAIREAVRQAMVRHKRLGESIAVSRNGTIVTIPPEEIPEDGESWPASSS
jgi:hypothetical protein